MDFMIGCNYWDREHGTDKSKIPPPWSAVRAKEEETGCTVEVWGRQYRIGKNLLFSSITANGRELLAAPIRLLMGENGHPAEWKKTDAFLGHCSEEKAVIYATAESEAFLVNTALTVEFDGYVTADVKLMPKGYTVPQLFGLEKKDPPKTNLDYFYLEVPLKKEEATLYHLYPSHIMPDETGNTAGTTLYAGSGLLPEQGIAAEFSAVTFAGNDERGLFVYAESDRYWQPADPKKAVSFLPGKKETVLRFCLIDGQPKAWRAIGTDQGQYEYPDLSFRLGFQATPVKPFPENPYQEKRLHIDCFKKIPQEYLEFLSNPVVEGESEIGYDRIKRLGVTTLILHEKWNQIQNYWMLTERTRRQLKTIIAECHQRGIKVVPYFGYEISTMADIWHEEAARCKRIGSEMRKGLYWYRFPAQREHPVCYNSPIAQPFADGIEALVDEFDFDGIYLDGTAMVWNCKNTAHGCGYYDEEGNLHPTYPIAGVRRLMRRLYEIFETRGKTINCHVSDCICPAGISFAHSLWLGEYIQYSLVKQGAQEMPEGYLRATHSGRNFGLPTEFIVYENKPIWSFHDALAFSLVHGVLPRPNDIGEPLEKMAEIWKIIDRFPVDQAEWIPYFKGTPFTADHPAVRISGYCCRQGKAPKWLLFVANATTSPVSECRVSGFPAGATVRNAYTGAELPVENGAVSLSMERFGHAIWEIG